MPKYFMTCARGLEPVAARELDAVGATNVEESHGGVSFEGDQGVLYSAHLWSRVGNRILYPLREALVHTPDDVYEMVKAFRWETFFKHSSNTLAVDCTVSGQNPDGLHNSHFLRLRVKDAIVDRLREKTGARPDIDTERPDISVYLYVRNRTAVLGLEATGSSMHERGYRSFGAEAPLKETLAAGILALSGWTADKPLVDPLCGSGTFLLEAGLIATNTAPGLARRHYQFMNWPEFYAKRWDDLCQEAKAQQRALPKDLLFGSDRDAGALQLGQDSARKLGWSEINWSVQDFRTIAKAPTEQAGFVICNPPYGERLGTVETLAPLYKALGDLFKKGFKGWTGYIFCEHGELPKSIGLKASKRVPLFNGPLECRLLKFDLY